MRGSIRQRSKGSWEICIDVGRDPATGRRLRHFESTKGNKGAAHQRLAQLLVEVENSAYIRTPRNLTVADYLKDWLHDYVELNCAPKTIESYRSLIELHLTPEIGTVRLADLQPSHLQALYARKKEGGLSSRTVRYLYSLMIQALDHAVRTGLLARNVARATKPPRLEHRVMPTMKTEDLERFFELAKKTPLYHHLFYTMLHTGLRRGEALALKWKSVDMGLASLGVAAYISVTQSLNKVNGHLVIREPKTVAGKRRIALSPSLVLLLRQHRDEQSTACALLGRKLNDEDYVFSHLEGEPLDPSTVSHAFSRILRQAGLPSMPLHSLRHSHATFLLQAGIHPRVAMERLGHSSIRVTLDTYSHVIGGLQEAAAQRFDDFISAKGNRTQNVGKMSADRTKEITDSTKSESG
jgi:integrase